MIKKCRSCKADIPVDAKKCSHCGTDQRNWFARHKIITAILGIIILSGIFGAAGGSKSGTSSSTTSSQSSTNADNPKPTDSKPKQYVTVIEASGSSDKRTDTFDLQGGKTKLTYTFTGGDAIVGAIYVMKDGTSLQKQGGFPEVTVTKSGTDSTFLTKDAGSYYLDVKSANASWTIKVEEEK